MKTPFLHGLFALLSISLSAALVTSCSKANSQSGREQALPSEARALPASNDAEPFVPQRVLVETDKLVPIIGPLPIFNLIDHRGQSLSKDDLYGKIWVVNFLYTDCTDLCDLQTSLMNTVETALAPQLGDAIRFVTITIDPETDTAQTLAQYATEHGETSPQRHFLTGPLTNISQFMQSGFNLPPHPSTSTSTLAGPHNTDLFLIDWEGRFRGQYSMVDETANAIERSEFSRFQKELELVYFEQKVLPESLHSFTDPRQAEQQELATDLDIFTDFAFQDEIAQSGIDFRHMIVDDAGTDYKAVHYDHGNGMAIADVDLDGFYDIYFTTLSGTNELWRNLGDGRFENITETSGLQITDRIGMGASFADIDNDGDPDLYISNVRVGNILFENDGTGQFTNITETSGTGVQAHSSAAIFFDYDRDGLLDLFVANVGQYTTDEKRNTTLYSDQGQVTSPYEYYVGFKDAFAGHLKPERSETSTLFRNLGNNQFEDVTAKLGLTDDGWSGDAAIIDGNNDGWPDLYVLNMQGNDEYFENQNGERFVRRSRDVFEKTPWGAMGARAFDYDNDGDMDLYVTDMHSDMRDYIGIDKEKLKGDNQDPESFLRSGGNSIFGNAFFRNEGDGSFTEISDQIGLENYWPWGASSGDLNADGYEDLFVSSSMSYPFRYHINSVFLNDQGRRFVDSEYMLGVEPRRNNIISKPWFEIDCQGADRTHLVCENSNTPTPGRTVVWGALGTRSSVIFDLDNDGDQDIVTLEFNHLPMVLINNLSDQKPINFLKLELEGRQSNHAGIGSIVSIHAGERTYTKVHDGKSGYLGQSLAPLYFGLGENETIDAIEIIWPSGIRQDVTESLSLNTLIKIAEPSQN